MSLSRKNKRKSKATKSSAQPGRGFDFGQLPRALFASTSSFDFNTHMVAARVNGCAYGYDKVDGYPFPLPCLTFLGEHGDELLKASKCLEYWGCREDGDSVDMTIVLKDDGGYLLGMQPNWTRMANRSRKDTALVESIFTGATWIKTLDSTNPILRDWKEYRKSKLAPIKIRFATVESEKRVPKPGTIRDLPGAIEFVKFDLQILTEADDPKHWFLDIVRHETKVKGAKVARQASPESVAEARRGVIDGVFPLSRERIRRAKLPARVQAISNADYIALAQIEQAAINVVLSREWAEGRDHYQGLIELEDQWWKLAGKRVEVCGTPDVFETLDEATVLQQLVFDVEHTLKKHGATISNKFATNQRQFVRLGYAEA